MDALSTFKQELENTLIEINKVIDEVKRTAEMTSGWPPNVYAMRDADGSFTLTPLLVAKAQVLATMEVLTRPK